MEIEMNLQKLYERTKDLNYIEIEKLGAKLSAKFIILYVSEVEVDESDPVRYIQELLHLSLEKSHEQKLKILTEHNVNISELSKLIDVYKSEVKEINNDVFMYDSSSNVAIGMFDLNLSRAKANSEDSKGYLKIAKELKSLLRCLCSEDISSSKEARRKYKDQHFDFNSLNYITTNMFANILYPIFPTAFPLTNGHVQRGFVAFDLMNSKNLEGYKNLDKLRDSTTPEDYITLAERMDTEIFNKLGLKDEERHFGVIDKMFHVYSINHEIAHFDSPNTILYGAPGTSKTYEVFKKMEFLKDVDGAVVHKMQFHPSFTYEDFIEGIKPMGVSENGNIKFELVNGVFKKFCMDAKNNPDKDYYFVVDEINRANLATVFGETLSLIEKDYRHDPDPKKDSKDNLIQTQYSSLIEELIKEDKTKEDSLVYARDGNGKVAFGVPKNVYFIGMMNDVDKSIDTFDLALRRRFKWIRKDCKYDVIKEIKFKNGSDNFKNIDEYADCAEALNKYISQELLLGKSYEFGHSFFMKMSGIPKNTIISESNLETLFDSHLRPTLKEYLRAFYPENEIEGNNGKGGMLKEALEKFQSKLSDKKSNSDIGSDK